MRRGPAVRSSSASRPPPHLAQVAALAAVTCAVEAAAVHLGRTFGSTRAERAATLPGDEIIARPQVVTNHATTIDAPPSAVWPWLLQMGWHRGGWYTARWVDRLLFPDNLASADELHPEWQDVRVGTFIPDGAPSTGCGLVVEQLIPDRSLVLHSTSHLPRSWRDRDVARLDWTWTFHLTPEDDGRRTRFLFRSRWTTWPWWLTAGGWLLVVPADFVMARSMLRGLAQRVDAQQLRGLGRPLVGRDREPSCRTLTG